GDALSVGRDDSARAAFGGVRNKIPTSLSCPPKRSCPFCPFYDLDDTGRILSPTASGRRGAPDFRVLGRTEFALRNSPPAAPNLRATWRAPPLAAFGTKFYFPFLSTKTI